MILRYFKKEFVEFTDLEVNTLCFEAVPSIGRYISKYCQKIGEGVFRVEIVAPEGDLFYNFREESSNISIDAETNCNQNGPRSWHYCKLGTIGPLPIEFQLNPSFCGLITDDCLEIRIIRREEWIQQVTLLCYDTTGRFTIEQTPEICYTFKKFQFLRYLIPFKTAINQQYCFKIYANQRYYYYGADKKLSKSPPPLFKLTSVEPLQPWEKQPHTGIVYQIFPDTFWRAASLEPAMTPVTLAKWDSPPSSKVFFGGNFKGILQKLDYLEQLGIRFIYLTPIFPASSNHRYDCNNFHDLDPILGSPEDFRALISACHHRGIKVVLEAIFNHCGLSFRAFQDVLERQENSKYKDWFIIKHFPVTVTDAEPNYSYWWDVISMPQFNLDNPEVKAYLLEEYSFWLTEYKIDGFRIDVAPELGYHVLRQIRDILKTIKSDVLIIGEVWGDSSKFLHYGLFDGATNYHLRQNAFLAYFVKKNIGLAEFAYYLMRNYFSLPFTQLLQSWNMLDSHDTARFSSLVSQRNMLRLAVFLQMLLPGNPMIYYGNEIGLEGMEDPDNRRCMDWNQVDGNVLLDWYKRLIAVRNQEIVLQKGDLMILEASDESGLLIFTRGLNGETIYCIANFSESHLVQNIMELLPSGGYRELITKLKIQEKLTLEPSQALVLKRLTD